MEGLVTIRGNTVHAFTPKGDDCRIELTPECLDRMRSLAERYRKSVIARDSTLLMGLGNELFAWLDESGWATAWVRGSGNRVLRIRVNDSGAEGAAELLDLPWEILAWNKDFLAADPAQAYVVYRGIHQGPDPVPEEAQYKDLALLFMASSPRGQRELDFEAEEAGILAATAKLPLQLNVEESGSLEFMKDRMALDGPFEAVHLSCHGTIHEDKGPVLALETPEGDKAPALPGDVADALGEGRAPLVFLSACRTAEAGGEDPARPGAGESFCRSLIRSGVANVLGWDGSVYDRDATRFARSFYRELAEYASVPYAAAVARREVLKEHRQQGGGPALDGEKKIGEPGGGSEQDCHWHLARVYVGDQGGGALCRRQGKGRTLRRDAGFQEFLDQTRREVPVASARTFVGRRRLAQSVLRAFREPHGAGVLLYGMGNIGKSSLAARVANRLPRLNTVVIHGRYDGLTVFDRLLAALPPRDRQAVEAAWRPGIAKNEAVLGNALEEMLKGPLKENPILLIVDDLEQILEDPSPGQETTPVKENHREALAAILRAFFAVDTGSRLLLTSRYRFALPDGQGGDLGKRLTAVSLYPMGEREREKQWRAVLDGKDGPGDKGRELARQIQKEAAGNPGLQDILCRPLLSGEIKAAARALEAVKQWKKSGEVPQEESAAQDFFQRETLKTYEAALTSGEKAQLRAATVFSEGLPVPVEALEVVGAAAEVGNPAAAVARLAGLGLFDLWGEIDGVEYASANPLARPLAKGALSEKEEEQLAAAAMPVLAKLWTDKDGDFPIDPRGVEAARLALAGKVSGRVLEKAAKAGGAFLHRGEQNPPAAWSIFAQALERLEMEKSLSDPIFAKVASECAESVGETKHQVKILEQGLALDSGDKRDRATLAVEHATATLMQGSSKKALKTLQWAADLFQEEGDEVSWARTKGRIADILVHTGEISEALRIRREEQIPVYERLGNVRSHAMTLGKITDILVQRGATEEALRILKEEVLPSFEWLGDVRSRAVTMGKIADILSLRGETDEALRIQKEELLPVFKHLGDVRSHAVTLGKIADIFFQQGETEEALRIRREEQLPVFERLGDLREHALTQSRVADILFRQGKLEEALRILLEECLPAFSALKDQNSIEPISK